MIQIERIAGLLLIPAVVAAGAVGWANLRLPPHWSWSACRLAMMLRPAFGLPLYPGGNDLPLNDWMYGPVAPLIYLPAALGNGPLAALHIATVLNALFFLASPAATLACLARDRAWRISAAWGFLFVVLAMLVPYGLWYTAAILQVDTIAIGLAVLSCIALIQFDRIGLAALLAALAVWTKQIELPLAVAQAIFLARARSWRAMWSYVRWFAAAMTALAIIFACVFGAGNLWENLVVMPSRYPFELDRLVPELRLLLRAGWWIPPVAGAAWRLLPRGARGDRSAELAWLLLLAAAWQLPVGMAAAVKYGGGQNSVHALAFGYVGSGLLLTLLAGHPARHVGRWVQTALVAGTLGLIGLKMHRAVAYNYFGAAWSGIRSEEAFQFARQHPGEAYFPWNTLVTLFAEKREYPHEGAYHDWLKLGRAPPAAEIRRRFPAGLKYVIYHQAEALDNDMLAVFPDFKALSVLGPWQIRFAPSRNAAPPPDVAAATVHSR